MYEDPPPPLVFGQTDPYPTIDGPTGANRLNNCGTANGNSTDKRVFSDFLTHGYGHVPVGTTKVGVSGFFDIGANVWEWVSHDQAIGGHHGRFIVV